MSEAELPIVIDRKKIADFCRERGIRRLSLFGSVLRHDFDPQHSDVDVLAELLPNARPGWEFFGWHQDLASIIGRKVDLHTPNSLSKYFREEVLQEALPVYEQA
jgi:predicted nucleotidyltransferase